MGMRYLPLLWAALWRNPLETLLTWLAATAAFTLFGLMVGLYVHTERTVEAQRMDRLYVVVRYPGTPFTGLPAGLAGQIARVEGVTGVGTSHWLNGYHADPRDSATVVAVDEGMPRGWPELPMTGGEWKELFSRPDGAFASRKAAKRWDLKAGDLFSITTPMDTQADGDPTRTFEVLGIIGDIPQRQQGFLLGNYHYVDDTEPLARRGLLNSFVVAISDPQSAGTICAAIDHRFVNSGTPTYCVPMRADAEGLVHGQGDIVAVTLSVAGAGLFMILFLIANGIARSVSERIPEFAVLATMGFREAQLSCLVALEAAVPCLLGAALGTGLGYLMTRLSIRAPPSGDLARLLARPEFPPAVLAWTLGFAILLAVASSVVPLLRLRRLSVVDALAGR